MTISIEEIKEMKEVASFHGDSRTTAICDELLAVREARSIGFIQDRASGHDSYVLKAFYGANLNIGDKVYAAPPAPTVPAGFKLVPVELTAENGAKASLIGEFTEVKYINCHECLGDDECESCDGSGRIKVEAPVSWTTIKAIWRKGIEHFDSLAAAPTPTKAVPDA